MAGNSSPKQIRLNESFDYQSPLRGCVICCTSVPDEKRTEIAQWAEQMGAKHTLDLTVEVTHLIIADYRTDKYRYVARERQDVQPMTVQWLEAVRELWMNDQEIDFAALEAQHRLPTFHSLRFSMTGCDDQRERIEIADQVKANGATYEGDLTKHITHLISFQTTGAKYKAAKTWGINIVSVEWLRDSTERGMILDEKLYDPTLAVEERGKGAWDRTKPTRQSLGKRSREGSTTSLEGGKRKLRRTASTKLSNQSANIWGDIVGGNPAVQVNRSGVWDVEDTSVPQLQRPKTRDSLPPTTRPSSMQSTIENPANRGIFHNCRFYLHSFPDKNYKILFDHLTSNGAEISEKVEDLVNADLSDRQGNLKRLFRVVSPSLPIKDFPLLPESLSKVETITVWWVERCLYGKKFMEPGESVIGRPFPVFPIEKFDEITISSSSFSGIDLLHLKKTVDLIGGKYSEEMTPQSSVLVTKSVSMLRRDKSQAAQEWNIPILKADWLWDSIKSGERLPWAKYQLRLSRTRTDSLPSLKEPPAKVLHRSKSEILKPVATSSSDSSSKTARPPQNSGLDDDAFAEDDPRPKVTKPSRLSVLDDTAFANNENDFILRPTARPSEPDVSAFSMEDSNVKEEQVTQIPALPDASSSTQELSMKAPPLSERSVNSPTRTVSTAPLPSEPPLKPKEDLSNTLSSLLAKTKPATTDSSDPRRRGGNRILGRVTSNVSAGSTSRSRATSVDSTASHGHPVQYPSFVAGKTANEQIDMLINDRVQRPEDIDSQPPSNTQVQYDDPESEIARELVMARMNGKTPGPKKRAAMKAKVDSIGKFMVGKTRKSGRTGINK